MELDINKKSLIRIVDKLVKVKQKLVGQRKYLGTGVIEIREVYNIFQVCFLRIFWVLIKKIRKSLRSVYYRVDLKERNSSYVKGIIIFVRFFFYIVFVMEQSFYLRGKGNVFDLMVQ